MKKFLLGLCLLLSFFMQPAFAGGGMTHMYLAQQSLPHLQDKELQYLLQNNMDAYLVGSYYPDSGYLKGTRHGEDSHWDEFVFAFSDYLRDRYAYPAIENPKLVAFLFGVATHRVSDEILHHEFYFEMSRHDFQYDQSKAHRYGDIGIDLVLNIDRDQWQKYPKNWWIPVNHLVAVYKKMKKDYTAQEIIFGNSILRFAGIGERLISVPAYPVLQFRMPWTANHYMDWPNSGLKSEAKKIADYQNKLWIRLNTKQKTLARYSAKKPYDDSTLPIFVFAEEAISSGAVRIPVQMNADGSVEIQDPIIVNAGKLEAMVREFILKICQW